jgi:hypothetical protein
VQLTNTVLLKRAILCFWALWFTLAVITNLMDGLKALEILSDTWPLASGNYALIIEVMQAYTPAPWLTAGLFLGAIAWESLAAFLFWQAFRKFRGIDQGNQDIVYIAFTASLGLWAAFILIDEIFIAYAIENTHRQLLILQLLSLLALRVLPDEVPTRDPL